MTLSVGLIGYGIWGKKILGELVAIHANVYILDINETLKDHAISSGASMFTSVFSEFLSFQLDGIILASATSTHLDYLQKLSGVSKPLFVEKPLVNSAGELHKIKKLNLDNTFMMHIWKYHPGIQKLAEIANGGELGSVKAVKSMRANWTSPRTDTDTLWNLAIHDLSIAETILGEIPAAKHAVCSRYNGIIRGAVVLMGSDPYYHFEVSNRYPEKHREVMVFGTKGIAVLPSENHAKIHVYYGDDISLPDHIQFEEVSIEPTSPLRIELESFINYLRGGPPPITDLEEGIRLIESIIEIEKLLTNGE